MFINSLRFKASGPETEDDGPFGCLFSFGTGYVIFRGNVLGMRACLCSLWHFPPKSFRLSDGFVRCCC